VPARPPVTAEKWRAGEERDSWPLLLASSTTPSPFHLQALPVLFSTPVLVSAARERSGGAAVEGDRDRNRTDRGRRGRRVPSPIHNSATAGAGAGAGGGGGRRHPLQASEANAAVLDSQICSAALCSPGILEAESKDCSRSCRAWPRRRSAVPGRAI